MTNSRHRLVSIVTLGLLAGLGVILVLMATPEGLGLSDDSIAYVAGARSMLAGHGYREAWLASNGPVTHFPPGFASVLALVGMLGLDPLRAARFVNAMLFGLNATLMGILGWRMTRWLPAGPAVAALFVASGSFLRVHAVAMSEPLFIFLSLAAFWCFDLYFERDRYWPWLVWTAAFTGAAYLTRYAGLALAATFLLAIFVLHDTWRQRLAGAGIFLAGFLPWAAGWAIRNQIVAGNATNRILVWHPITSENVRLAIFNVSEFLVPVEAWRRTLIRIPGLFETIIILILGAILFWIGTLVRRRLLAPGSAPPWRVIEFTSGLYIFGYLASILAAMTLFDASTKFKLRIMSPLYVSLLILLVALGVWAWGRRRDLVILLAALTLVLSTYDQVLTIDQLRKGGEGYASFTWYDSKAMAFLRSLPADTMIYTNEPGAVYLYTGRASYVLPNRFDPVTAEARPGFAEGMALMQAEILSGRAVLALFDGGETPAGEAALLTRGLYLAHKSAGDEIYMAAP
jgi:hypothetical protein